MLPPLKNNVGDLVERKCGCQFEKCAHAACKNKELKLDAAGNHGLICHPGVKVMSNFTGKSFGERFSSSWRQSNQAAFDLLSSWWPLHQRRFILLISWTLESGRCRKVEETCYGFSGYCC